MNKALDLIITKRKRLQDLFLFQKNGATVLWDKLTLNAYSLDKKHKEFFNKLLKIENQEELKRFIISEINKSPELENELIELFQDSNLKKESKSLRRLNLLISQKCLLGCLYCYAKKGTYGHPSFMNPLIVKNSLESFLSIFDNIGMIQFFGGEPLLNLELIEYTIKLIQEIVSEKNIQEEPDFLVESGLGVPEEIVRKFAKLLQVHPEIRLTVSCDGPSEIQNILRPFRNGKPSYNSVIGNLNYLKKYGQPHAIEVTYTKIHFDKGILPSDLINYFKEELGLKDSLVFVIPVISKDPSLALPRNVEIEMLYEYDFKMLKSVKNVTSYPRYSIDEFKKYVENTVLSYVPSKYFCDGGIESYAVDTFGDIYPCHMLVGMEKFKIGNVGENIEKLKMNLENFAIKQKKIVEKARYDKCKNCYLENYCSSCPSANYLLKGNMVPSFSDCEIRKQTLKELLLEYAKITSQEV